MSMLAYEAEARLSGHRVIAGVDEAGRGPLAGPVVAAAVSFEEGIYIPGLTDSKKLSAAARDEFYAVIGKTAAAVGVGVVDAGTIDSINILQAAMLAMLRAVEDMGVSPGMLLIDGNRPINWPGPQRAIVKGDSLSLSIAAASVIAKVTRDRMMNELAAAYPEYGFELHKGYGSAAHRKAIAEHGPCPVHRKTFKGVREFVPQAPPDAPARKKNIQLDLLG